MRVCRRSRIEHGMRLSINPKKSTLGHYFSAIPDRRATARLNSYRTGVAELLALEEYVWKSPRSSTYLGPSLQVKALHPQTASRSSNKLHYRLPRSLLVSEQPAASLQLRQDSGSSITPSRTTSSKPESAPESQIQFQTPSDQRSLISPTEDVGQHTADDIGAEPTPGQRSGDASSLRIVAKAGHRVQLLAGKRSRRSELVVTTNLLERRFDVVPVDALGLKLAPEGRSGQVTPGLTRFHPISGEPCVVEQANCFEAVEDPLSGLIWYPPVPQSLVQLAPRARLDRKLGQGDPVCDRLRIALSLGVRGGQNSTSPVIGSMPAGASNLGPIPIRSLIRFSSSLAKSGLLRR
jgi:hypothetical protein